MELAEATAADHVITALKGRGHTVRWWWDHTHDQEAMTIALPDGSTLHISDATDSADHYPIEHLSGWRARHYPHAAHDDYTTHTTVYRGQPGTDFVADTRALVVAVCRFIATY